VTSSSETRQAVHADSAFLTVDEVAGRLGMSRWFVYAHGDELGRVKFGGSNRYRADRVDAYLAERLAGTAEEPAPTRTPRPPAERKPAPRRGRRRRVPLLEPDGRGAA
jgi:excisionase family DNA binding protein